MRRATIILLCLAPAAAGGNNYKNFDVALYSRVYETRQMNDPAWLESHWAAVSKNMKVDKIYLETSRDMVVVDQATLDQAKKFFLGKGLKVAGGITVTVSEANRFETYCYSNPEHRQKLKDIVEFTARNFSSRYSKGMLYVLTIPEDEGDLYYYPQNVLAQIRNVLARDMWVRLDAPAMVSLFVYDNDKFIVKSFGDAPVQARIVTDARITKLHDLVTGEEIAAQAGAGVAGGRAAQAPGGAAAAAGGRGGLMRAPGGRGGQPAVTTFDVPLKNGSYRVFSVE